MSWNDVIGRAEGAGRGAQDHLQIAPNTSKVVHILLEAGEEPYSFWTHYIPEANGGKGRGVVCPGRDICPACAKGIYKTRRRHAINVYDIENKAIKVLEAGKTIMEQLKMILDAYGSFAGIDVSIRKTGEKMNTQYGVIPIPRKEPFDKSLVANGKFALASIKAPNTPDAITTLMSGVAKQVMASVPPAPVKAETKVPTEEKPQTDEEIAKEVDAMPMTESKPAPAVEPAVVAPEPPAPELNTLLPNRDQVTDSVYKLINNDPRYQNNFQIVVNKMKEATASPTHPNGKTLLQEYSIEELVKLEALLK